MARFYPTGGTGGANVSVVTALAEDVAKGKVIVGPDGKPITGTLELTGTAADSQVLAGQTYYNTDLKGKRTGTMTNRGAWNSSGLAAGAAVTIPAGYHNGGGKVTAKDLASQTPGDATAAQIWTGKKAWVGGRQITGTLATQGGSTTTPGTAAKTIVTPNKIVTGNIVVAGDSRLVAGNIKKGVSIFGVTGTWEGYVANPTDLYRRGVNPSGLSRKDGYDMYYTVSLLTDHIQIKVDDDVSYFTTGVGFETSTSYNLTGYTGIAVRLKGRRNKTSSSGEDIIVGYGGMGSYGRPLNRMGALDLDGAGLTTEKEYLIPFNDGTHSVTTKVFITFAGNMMELPQTLYIYQIRLY